MNRNKNFSNMIFIGLVLISAVFLSGCEYTGSSLLPSHINKIYITPFINKSFRPDLPEKILWAVEKEFISDGRLIVSNQKDADAVLYGEITQYTLQPMSYTEQMNVQEYRLRIVIDIWLDDLQQGSVLWKEKDIEVYTTASSTQGGLEVKIEGEVINEVVEKLARKVVKRVIDGWT